MSTSTSAAEGVGPFLWLSEKGSPFGFRTLPPGGLCLSSFLFVRRGGKLLVGRYADDARWETLTGLDADRRRAHSGGWTIPASHLKLGESPQEAARRVARDVLRLPDVEPSEPRVVSEVGEPRRFPGMVHQDVIFLHDLALPDDAQVATPPWYAELAWIDPRGTPASAWARSHDEVLARWLDLPRPGHANLVTARFRDAAGFEAAKAQLDPFLAELAQVPGVLACYHVQTGPLEIVNVAVYASAEAARAGAAKLAARVGAILGPHVAAPPQVSSGPVVGHV